MPDEPSIKKLINPLVKHLLDKSNNDSLGIYDAFVSSIILQTNSYQERILASKSFFSAATSAEANVFIGLPQEHIDFQSIERIQNAVGGFMESMGFKLKSENKPVIGSFFKSLKFSFKGEKNEIEGVYAGGEKALSSACGGVSAVDVSPSPELLKTAPALIASLDGVDEGIIMMGRILIVKVTKYGVKRLIVKLLSDKTIGFLKIILNCLKIHTLFFPYLLR